MEIIKKIWAIIKRPLWIGITLLIGIIAFVLLRISEGQFPNLPLSSGIVAFISAVIGVLLTAFAISVQLKQQSEAETQKSKEMRIYQEQIRVYSGFSSMMWKKFSDVDRSTPQDKIALLDELRLECFDKLVFFLSPTRINELTKVFKEITNRKGEFDLTSLCEVTHILKESLKDGEEKKEKLEDKYLKAFYNAFEKGEEGKNDEDTKDLANSKENTIEECKEKERKQPLTFWHFNMWGEQQITTFKEGKWILNLIEYEEDEKCWRTWKVENQVQQGDVVFLFRRGGYGYIGVFKVTGIRILKKSEYAEGKYTNEDIKLYDMYNVMENGATYSSNIIVEPLAFNFKGIYYRTVRRRTIEKMVNDMGNVKFLFDRFEGNNLDEEPHRLEGKDKLDPDTPVKFDEEYLKKLKKQYNL